MRNIIKSLIVASALVAGGSAYAAGDQVETNVLSFATKATVTHSGSTPRADDIVTNSIRAKASAMVSDQSYANSGR
jgi:uncharacterized protein YdgA (DUF945 family)